MNRQEQVHRRAVKEYLDNITIFVDFDSLLVVELRFSEMDPGSSEMDPRSVCYEVKNQKSISDFLKLVLHSKDVKLLAAKVVIGRGVLSTLNIAKEQMLANLKSTMRGTITSLQKINAVPNLYKIKYKQEEVPSS